ncbi:MAG: hypothetical protein HY841_05910 [Bacteroidetes bacterium]|nr:hypothetical protein [Bacteroidota bacterium]
MIRYFFILNFSLFIVNCFSQPTLPLYEKNEKGEVLLLRIDSFPKDLKKKFDTVSIISENGICYGKMSKFRMISQKECCTHPDPKFLLGTIKLKKKKCTGTMILGKIDCGKSLNYDSLKAKTNLFEMVSEEFQSPLINKEYLTRYRWKATEVDEKKDVYLQSISKNNNEDYVITYSVLLKNCIHIKTDSTDFYYCTTDTTGYSKKKNHSWYDDRITWSLLYVNQKLIYVIPDFSSTTIDGYGPFHGKEQKFSSIYKAKGITYYYFSPGYVIYYRNKEWKYATREPVMYYGECDCGE